MKYYLLLLHLILFENHHLVAYSFYFLNSVFNRDLNFKGGSWKSLIITARRMSRAICRHRQWHGSSVLMISPTLTSSVSCRVGRLCECLLQQQHFVHCLNNSFNTAASTSSMRNPSLPCLFLYSYSSSSRMFMLYDKRPVNCEPISRMYSLCSGYPNEYIKRIVSRGSVLRYIFVWIMVSSFQFNFL